MLNAAKKIAFVGRNGEGKTTLSRIIIGELDAEGTYKTGYNVNIGYFAQNQDELLNNEKTVLKTIDDVAVGDIRTKIRDILGAFLFSGEDVDKKVKVLSGGEKSRLSMAKLLLEPYNLLVLDEPTNHLDMRSKDILKQALMAYDGTLILVSHDRDFLNGLTDKIYEFKGKKIKEHRCSIYEFLEKKNLITLNQLNLKLPNEKTSGTNSLGDNKAGYIEKKEFDKRIRKIQKQIEGIEQSIENIEARQTEIEHLLSNGQPQDVLFIEYEKNKQILFRLMQEWETENTRLEGIKN